MHAFECYLASLPPCPSAAAYSDNGIIMAYEDGENAERYSLNDMSCTVQTEFVIRQFTADDSGPDYGALVWIATEGHLGVIFCNRRDSMFQKALRDELAAAVFFHFDSTIPNHGMPLTPQPDIGDALIRLSWAEVCRLVSKYRPSINLSSIHITELRGDQ